MRLRMTVLAIVTLLLAASAPAALLGANKSAKANRLARSIAPAPGTTARSVQGIVNSLQSLVPLAPSASRQPSLQGPSPAVSLGPLAARARFQIPALSANVDRIRNVSWSEGTGVPNKIEIEPQGLPAPTPLTQTAGAVAAKASAAAAEAFLARNASLLKIQDPATEFSVAGLEADERGVTHVRFQQTYAGVEVWGGDAYVHLTPQGEPYLFNGSYYRTPTLPSVSPRITGPAAIQMVQSDLTARRESGELPAGLARIVGYEGPTARQVIWHDKMSLPHLAWLVELQTGLQASWRYFVDAGTGSVLNRYNDVKADGAVTASGMDLNGVQRNFGSYGVGTQFYLIDAAQPMYDGAKSQIPQNPVGAVVGLDQRNRDFKTGNDSYYVVSADNKWSDPATVSAHFNALRTYNFYRQVYNRNSIDGKGMTIYSIVHVTKDSLPMDNAFWSSTVMCYGDGKDAFKPLAGGFDVAAHEMTHGVTQHTSNLIYQEQSGALNESLSDVFAAIMDSANWTIGEDVIKDRQSYPTGFLRDMSNPHNGGVAGSASWQPATMTEFVTTTRDNGGVHVNSGIPNFAFYKVATVLGRGKAGTIWYKAQTNYLTQSAKFTDARIATEAAPKEIYGATSPELTAVKNAWDAVQVPEGTQDKTPTPSAPVGDNWVLIVNTDPNDPNSIYMAKSIIQSNADFFPLSQTRVATHPAVSDTSGIVLFVDDHYRLRTLIANPQNPQERLLDTNSIWWSVTVGPGMSRVALTTRLPDTSIIVIDNINHTGVQYKIRFPSNDGPALNTAIYADALSFDPTGQFVLFDVYNQTRTALGDTLAYWTIGLLDVTNGTMQSILPPQPEGVDVGDPAFSKTSPYRFTFDYLSGGNAYVLAADFFKGDVGQVAGPLLALGYPSYSGDDKKIIYHTLTQTSGVYHDALEVMPLDTSFINGTNSPVSYAVDATFPYWFVIGRRTQTTGVEEPGGAGIPTAMELQQNYPNPFNPSTMIRYSLPGRAHVVLAVFNALGQEVARLVDGEAEAGTYQVRFDGSGLASGMYFYRLQAGNRSQIKKLMVLK